MSEKLIWAAAKRTIKIYLSKIHTEHGFSLEETDYDILIAEEQMVVFIIHETMKNLIEDEIKRKTLRKSYGIHFTKNKDKKDIWEMQLKASGYESYVFAGILNGIVENLQKIKSNEIEASKKAILVVIKEALSLARVSSKFNTGLKYDENSGVYSVSITFKDYPEWKAVEFKDIDVLHLISTIAKDLPLKITEMG